MLIIFSRIIKLITNHLRLLIKQDHLKSNLNISLFPISINDLKDRLYAGEAMTLDEKIAIINYDKLRLDYLDSADNEEEFNRRYMELQVRANLSPYSDFL